MFHIFVNSEIFFLRKFQNIGLGTQDFGFFALKLVWGQILVQIQQHVADFETISRFSSNAFEVSYGRGKSEQVAGSVTSLQSVSWLATTGSANGESSYAYQITNAFHIYIYIYIYIYICYVFCCFVWNLKFWALGLTTLNSSH